jgi:prepilin-type N-terminal cleavage/methylation domain-containing protein
MIKNIKGFTLVEIMIAMGISSVLVLTVQQVMNKTYTTSRSVEQVTSMNELVFQTMINLEKEGSCTETLAGLDPRGLYPAGAVIPELKRKNGSVAFSRSDIIGTGPSRIEIFDMQVSNYEDSTTVGFSNGTKQATVSLTLKRASAIGENLGALTEPELAKLREREGSSKLIETFKIPVNVIIDGATNLIINCSYGLASIDNDVLKSCTMLGGTIDAVTDKCGNLEIEAQSGVPSPVHNEVATGIALFANGSMRVNDLTGTSYFKTDSLEINTSANPSYATGTRALVVDNLSTGQIGFGSHAIPGSDGRLDINGLILVGSAASSFRPSSGMAVGGDLVFPNTRRLYINDMPTTTELGAMSSADAARVVTTAKWAADNIADAMATSSASISGLSTTLLGGGTAVARNTIYQYICQNIRIRSLNTSGGAGGVRSVTTNYASGTWDGTNCNFSNNFKANCSATGACYDIYPDRLCMGGDCKTRWPYATKTTATFACNWKSSCSGTEKQFGTRTNVNPNWNNLTLCCPVRMSDLNAP